MERNSYAGSIDPGNCISLGHPAAQALIALLSTATATLDIDRMQAKDCIARASALIRAQALRKEDEGFMSMPPRGGLAPWQAKRLAAYINSHLHSKIHAEELADLAMISMGHFFRAFRESFGEAPMVYVAQQRMRLAQEIMLRTQEPLSQVALSCGFCDQAHFTRVFRRVVGMSPRAWRRAFAGAPRITHKSAISFG